jgi:hypothetical protein
LDDQVIAVDERAFIARLGTSLPSGWSLNGPDRPVEFDATAQSPAGNLFPIEVRSGQGLLDVTAVVDFGVEAERLAAAMSDVKVSPMIVTTQRVGSASADYAAMLQVRVVEAARSKDGVTMDSVPVVGQVVDTLTSVDRRIESEKMVAAALTQELDFSGWLLQLTTADEDRLAVRGAGDNTVLSADDPDAPLEIVVALEQSGAWYVTAYAEIDVDQVQLVLVWGDGTQASSELFELYGRLDIRTSIAAPDQRRDPPALIQVRRTAV